MALNSTKPNKMFFYEKKLSLKHQYTFELFYSNKTIAIDRGCQWSKLSIFAEWDYGKL
jgi:hypothetical protein